MCSRVGWCQGELKFNHYNSSDGLSNNVVRCTFQDQDGFLWFGTDDGLNRFDGRTFKVYKHVESEPHSISGNQILRIDDFANGDLLIATKDGGLNRMNRKSQTFVRYDLNIPRVTTTVMNNIVSFGFDHDSTLWVNVESNPLIKISPNGTFEANEGDSLVFTHTRFYDMQAISDGSFITAQLGGSVTRLMNGIWERIYVHGTYPQPANTLNCIFESEDHEVWLGAWDNGLHHLVDDSIETVFYLNDSKINHNSEEIYSINESGQFLWLGTRYTGLYLYDRGNNTCKNFTPDFFDSYSISSTTIYSIFKDADDRMWLGTDKGVDVYDPNLDSFNTVYLSGSARSSDITEKITSILPVDEGFLIGTTKGLWSTDVSLSTFTFHELTGKHGPVQVYSMYLDSQNKVLIGTNESIHTLDLKSMQLKDFETFVVANTWVEGNLNMFDLPASRIMSIAESEVLGEPIIWASAYGHGLLMSHAATSSTFICWAYSQTESNERDLHSLVNKIFRDSRGNVWLLGTSQGVLINPELDNPEMAKEAWKSHPHGIVKELGTTVIFAGVSGSRSHHLLGDISTSDIVEMPDGAFYLTTRGQGLIRIENSPNGIITESIPSPNNVIEGIERDAAGNLWMITSGGIKKFDPINRIWQGFDYFDGFPKAGVHGDLFALDDTTMIAFGQGYLVRFNPTQIGRYSRRPEHAITSFSVEGESFDNLLYAEDVVLSYDQNSVAFGFASLNYSDPGKNIFAYQLIGADKGWTECGTINQVNFANLEAGRYIFQVKSANKHGMWNDDPVQFAFTIVPIFWKRTWFLPLVIIFLFSLGLVWLRMRVTREKALQKSRMVLEIDAQEKERSRLSSELHDDISMKLSVLKLYLSSMDDLMEKSNPAAPINTKAQSMLDESLKDLRAVMLNISPDLVSRHGLFKAVSDLILRIGSTGIFILESQISDTDLRFDPRTELTLYRVIQELFNNAIKHAHCQRISIHLHVVKSVIRFEYMDDGIGLALTNTEKTQGFGIQNIENRLRLIGATSSWNSAPGKGLKVTITVEILAKNDA